MAVENETANKLDSGDETSNPVNINVDDEHDQDSKSDISSEMVALEVEFERLEVKNNITASKGQTDENNSFEMEVEDGAEEKDVPDTSVTQRQANTYAAKKTVAQGMMDIALITANANQLRFIIEFNSHSKTYYLNLFLIVISLLLQVGVGVSLIFKGRLDLRGESKHRNAKRINNYVVVGIFLVTIINVFIASFTITGSEKH